MITLLKDEEIILIQRRHWLPFLFEILPLAILTCLPFIFALFIFGGYLPSNLNNVFLNYKNYYFFFSFVFIFILWIISIVLWTNYYLDIIIITNKRIIDIEQFSFFSRDESEVRFEDIEDVKIEINGFWESLLKFGNIYIQTAAESGEFKIKNIENPEKIKDIISLQKEKVAEKKIS